MDAERFAIRRAQEADMPAVGRLAATLVREHHELDPTRFLAFPEPIEPNYQRYLTMEIHNPQAVLLVAVQPATETGQEQVVGYAWGQMRGRDYMAMLDAGGCIQDVYVTPQARRKGVARALLGAMVEALRGLGAQRIILHTAARNQAAQAFFHSLGFRPTMVEMMPEVTDGPRGSASRG